MDYTIFSIGDAFTAGMMAMPAAAQGAPSFWMVYFTVADCDASSKIATDLGGKLHHGPMEIPQAQGPLDVVEDPQGAMFGIISYFPTA